MTKYLIEGSNPINGKVSLPGSKNAVTKLLMASLLSDGISTIKNVPSILEIELTTNLLKSFGVKLDHDRNKGEITICAGNELSPKIPTEEASHNRMAILTLAPLLHRFEEVQIPINLGGDRIGPRPINFHLDAYRQFGAEITESGDHYSIRAERLNGATINLPYPSVSTTENVLLAATLAKGTTVIHGAAVEPEVLDLVLFLQKMGAIIELNTDRTYVVEGCEKLHGATHRVLPDRITCASLGAMAIATGGEITIEKARQEEMLAFLNVLRRMNAPFEVLDKGIRFGNGEMPKLSAISLETNVHPGFMTDWQPPVVILMSLANGISVLHETVYENRLGYTQTLNQMGAKIQLDTRCLGGTPCRFQYRDFEHSCIIHGPHPLTGIDMTVPDLRAGFSYVIAALCAKGKSKIEKVEEIERGYGKLDETLSQLGAKIERLES